MMKPINLPFEAVEESMKGLKSAEEIIVKLGGTIERVDQVGYNVAWFRKADSMQLHKARSQCHRLVQFGAIIESEHWIVLPYMAKTITWKAPTYVTD